MQLDKTHIRIRERSILEILDLSFHIIRTYARPLLICWLVGVIPLALLNLFIFGWMFYLEEWVMLPARFVWSMIWVVTLQAPIATVFMTAYLGQAVFSERPSVMKAMRSVGRTFVPLLVCNVILRGSLGVLMLWFVNRYEDFNPFLEIILPILALIFALSIRTFRPFVNEIAILEETPIRSQIETTVSLGRRSGMLHGPSYGINLIRSIVKTVVCFLLFFSFYGAFLCLSGTFFHDWRQTHVMVGLCFPLALWLVVGYSAVVKFLTYLDTRIRQEGWEVEILVRAEGTKLAKESMA